MLYSQVERGEVKTLLAWGNYKNSSVGSYWPASTIKLLPALAAVRKWKRLPLGVGNELWKSLRYSSNTAYDALVDKVTPNRVNQEAHRLRLKHTSIRMPYSRRGLFRVSKKWRKCRLNCTSLEDLTKIMVESMKHPLLRNALWRARCHLWKRCFNKTGYVGSRHALEVGFYRGKVLVVVIPATGNFSRDMKRLSRLGRLIQTSPRFK